MKTYKIIEDDPDEVHLFEELDLSKKYSYAHYLTWRFKDRVELIKGRIFKMSPAPGLLHQRVSSRLQGKIWHFLDKAKSQCEIFTAPFDVRFPTGSDEQTEIYSVVQPDLCVVCDPEKLDLRGCLGAPDLIVEILSPGSSRKDLNDKYELYETHGVREYWVVHPVEGTLLIYTLLEEGYVPSKLFTEGDIVSSEVLAGFSLELDEVF